MSIDDLHIIVSNLIKYNHAETALARFLCIKDKYPEYLKYSLALDISIMDDISFEHICEMYEYDTLTTAELTQLKLINTEERMEDSVLSLNSPLTRYEVLMNHFKKVNVNR